MHNVARKAIVEDDGVVETDDALACRARSGCRESFEALVRRFQVRLLRFLRRRVRESADAEDLLQETFIRAYEQLSRYDPRRSFATWLFTIAHRLAVSHHRGTAAAARASARLIAQQPATSIPDPHRMMADEESRQMFWETAAAVLSAEQMSAVWLFYVEQMTAPQIADVLGRSWVSVKTLLFRARQKLEPFVQAHSPIAMEEEDEAPGRRKSRSRACEEPAATQRQAACPRACERRLAVG